MIWLAQQYTFRLTRKTKWIEDIIELIPKQDKADFIRTCFVEGLKTMPEYQAYLDGILRPVEVKPIVMATPRPIKRPKIEFERTEETPEEADDMLDKLSSRFD